MAYVVGGSVRDHLLGRTPKDHDLATSATPDELVKIFKNAILTGKKFGVIRLPPTEDAPEGIEITTFRKDSAYADHRHPKQVVFSSPEEDALRRDFTMNALFYDSKTQRILDLVEGVKDIRAKVIRAVGNPHERFQEDALRILRAIRFVGALGFELESKTRAALHTHSRLLARISFERIRDEITGALLSPGAEKVAKLYEETGVLKAVLPELHGLTSTRLWTRTLKSLGLVAKLYPIRSASLAWAVFLHEIPLSPSQASVVSVCQRLRMSRNEIETVHFLCDELHKFRGVFRMRESTLERWVREPHFEELLALHHVAALASHGNLAAHEFCSYRFQKSRADTLPLRLISGEDLVQLGIHPGPIYAEILRSIETLRLEGRLSSKKEALEYVLNHFVT